MWAAFRKRNGNGPATCGKKAWPRHEKSWLIWPLPMPMEPEVLLLDEPTTGLMPLFVDSLQNIIRKLNDQGIAILLIEEKVPFALALAHRVNFMVKGKIEHVATKEELRGGREVFLKYLGVEA